MSSVKIEIKQLKSLPKLLRNINLIAENINKIGRNALQIEIPQFTFLCFVYFSFPLCIYGLFHGIYVFQ